NRSICSPLVPKDPYSSALTNRFAGARRRSMTRQLQVWSCPTINADRSDWCDFPLWVDAMSAGCPLVLQERRKSGHCSKSHLCQYRTFSLFDRLVDAGEQGARHRKAKRLGGLKIDHQFVLGRRLHRHVGGLLASEDAIDVTRRSPVVVQQVGSKRE